uniref:SHSP domain-containing protein n=1 Tax=Rhizophagus irregularis (strain DAOM 181602 / DAOM 197198 / MUCL 43194) TaxID=747089 RepID=U9TM38_RHIID
MRQKRKSEGLQPEIPEAPISESYDRSALIHEYLFPVSSQLFADSIRVEVLGDRVVIRGSAPEPPRIYEAPVSESDDEDMGIISELSAGK